jgi:hypothetical protein
MEDLQVFHLWEVCGTEQGFKPILPTTVCSDTVDVIEIIEERLVEKFVAHAAIECLADAVLHRLARRDEVQ